MSTPTSPYLDKAIELYAGLFQVQLEGVKHSYMLDSHVFRRVNVLRECLSSVAEQAALAEREACAKALQDYVRKMYGQFKEETDAIEHPIDKQNAITRNAGILAELSCTPEVVRSRSTPAPLEGEKQ